MSLNNSITVRGFRFKLDIRFDKSAEYECRGETYIDDYGLEIDMLKVELDEYIDGCSFWEV